MRLFSVHSTHCGRIPIARSLAYSLRRGLGSPKRCRCASRILPRKDWSFAKLNFARVASYGSMRPLSQRYKIIFSVEVSSPVTTITSLSRAEVASSATPSLPKASKRFSKPRAFKLDQVVQNLDYTIFDIASLSKRWRHLLIRGIGSRVICSRSARKWGPPAGRVPAVTWRARQSLWQTSPTSASPLRWEEADDLDCTSYYGVLTG